MQVYRADDVEAIRFIRLLTQQNLPTQLERFGTATYVVVLSERPDVPGLARAAGRSVRRVLSLDQLPAPKARTQSDPTGVLAEPAQPRA